MIKSKKGVYCGNRIMKRKCDCFEELQEVKMDIFNTVKITEIVSKPAYIRIFNQS